MSARFAARTTSDPSISSWGKPAAGGGISYGVATGGSSSSITVDGQAYTLLTFTTTGTLTVTKNGLFDVLAVGGGGAGGAAGGGAGGIQQTTVNLSSNADVQIGSGIAYGSQGPTVSNATKLSVGATNLVIGVHGGTGGSGYGFTTSYFTAGACAGGGTGQGPTTTGSQGFTGGNPNGATYGGGGGMGGAGANGTGSVGGAGGAGLDISAFLGQAATTTLKSGGGGGGPSGAGGSGGGGAAGNNGTANSGGGGGSDSGAGGSGILYVRFKV